MAAADVVYGFFLLVPLAACVGGVRLRSRARPWANRWILGLTAACMVLALAFVVAASVPGVPAGSVIGAVLVALIVEGALPSVGFYALGRALARHRIWLVLAFVVAMPVMLLLGIFALLEIAVLVGCPPGGLHCAAYP